jgi:hypothetical protein
MGSPGGHETGIVLLPRFVLDGVFLPFYILLSPLGTFFSYGEREGRVLVMLAANDTPKINSYYRCCYDCC